jgi:hypothetical protein
MPIGPYRSVLFTGSDLTTIYRVKAVAAIQFQPATPA